ncbi:MAG TPA: hypothetical protein VM692_12625, partial [Gammaproteobacteria bacterium]|nr:hypothetical protein [Gammaproteobacteria bacterium]
PARNPTSAATPPPAAPATATEPRAERRVRETEARVAPSAPSAPSAGRSDADDEEETIIPIVVVNTRTIPNRETTFTTKDGKTWVQTDTQRLVNLPETPFEAEIKSGAMGSYFLVAKDRPRAVRVRQVR